MTYTSVQIAISFRRSSQRLDAQTVGLYDDRLYSCAAGLRPTTAKGSKVEARTFTIFVNGFGVQTRLNAQGVIREL